MIGGCRLESSQVKSNLVGLQLVGLCFAHYGFYESVNLKRDRNKRATLTMLTTAYFDVHARCKRPSRQLQPVKAACTARMARSNPMMPPEIRRYPQISILVTGHDCWYLRARMASSHTVDLPWWCSTSMLPFHSGHRWRICHMHRHSLRLLRCPFYGAESSAYDCHRPLRPLCKSYFGND